MGWDVTLAKIDKVHEEIYTRKEEGKMMNRPLFQLESLFSLPCRWNLTWTQHFFRAPGVKPYVVYDYQCKRK